MTKQLDKNTKFKKPLVSFDRVYQKTSKALGVSYTSVHRIINGKRSCKSNRPKERANILDDFDGDKSDFLPILHKMQNVTIIMREMLVRFV
jgi:hypothetical protein